MNLYYKSKNNVNGLLNRYFHFIWGYFFPMLNDFRKQNKLQIKIIVERFDNPVYCKFDEFLQMLNINYEYITPESNIDKILKLRRIDAVFSSFQSRKRNKFKELIHNYLFTMFYNYDLPIIFKETLIKEILETRQWLLEILIQKFPELTQKYRNKNLIITRVDLESLHQNNLDIGLKGFGTTRKNLLGVDYFIKDMHNKNIDFEIFQCGNKSLVEQILAFYSASSIVGVRGSEFANLVWCHQNTKIFFINTNPETSATFAIPDLLKLNFNLYQSNHGFFPDLEKLGINESIYQKLHS